MSDLIFLRGLPGSGKSTLASLIRNLLQPEQCISLSADDWFTDYVTGEYKFDARQLRDAHADCQARAKNAMRFGFPLVIIHNTGTMDKELAPYRSLASKYRYQFHSVVVENRHGNASVHNVPERTLNAMRKRFTIQL